VVCAPALLAVAAQQRKSAMSADTTALGSGRARLSLIRA